MNTLSTHTRNALFSRLVFNGHQEDPAREHERARSRVVVIYRCNVCLDDFDNEYEAEECCAEEDTPEASASACPVCRHQVPDNYRGAADCCLWKDFDAPTRWRIADAVETGSDWITEIKKASEQ